MQVRDCCRLLGSATRLRVDGIDGVALYIPHLNTPLVVIARQGTSFHGLSLHRDVEAGSQASSWRRAPESVKYHFYNVQCTCSSYAHTAMPFLVCLAGSWTVLPPRRWAVPRRVGRDLSLGTAHDGNAYATRRNPPFLCRTMPAASPRVAAPPWRAPARGSRGCGTTSDASFFSPLAHAAPHESSVSAILHCFMYMLSSRDAIPGRQRHSLGQRTPHFRARTSYKHSHRPIVLACTVIAYPSSKRRKNLKTQN